MPDFRTATRPSPLIFSSLGELYEQYEALFLQGHPYRQQLVSSCGLRVTALRPVLPAPGQAQPRWTRRVQYRRGEATLPSQPRRSRAVHHRQSPSAPSPVRARYLAEAAPSLRVARPANGGPRVSEALRRSPLSVRAGPRRLEQERRLQDPGDGISREAESRSILVEEDAESAVGSGTGSSGRCSERPTAASVKRPPATLRGFHPHSVPTEVADGMIPPYAHRAKGQRRTAPLPDPDP